VKDYRNQSTELVSKFYLEITFTIFMKTKNNKMVATRNISD